MAEDQELFVDALTTKALAQQESAQVIDVRSAGRFAGVEAEPREGLRAGHIPSSVSLPFTSLLNDQGAFVVPEQVRQAVDAAAGGRQTLVSLAAVQVLPPALGRLQLMSLATPKSPSMTAPGQSGVRQTLPASARSSKSTR